MIILNLLRIVLIIAIAVLSGKLVAKLGMPAVLGCLITGMVFGPHALNLLTQDILDNTAYKIMLELFECGMGLMIGTELVWSKMRKLGKQIFVITLTQSLGTFVVVSSVFALIFSFMGIPAFLGMIFGGIALATAPAPALSIVNEYKTDGPVTKTLIPMAALDDVVAIVVFLSVMAFTLQKTAGSSIPAYLIILVVLLPMLIGTLSGFIVGKLLKAKKSSRSDSVIVGLGVLFASILTFLANEYIMPFPVLNFMLSGMAYSAVFSNIIDEERLESILPQIKPVLNFCFIVIILNLGAPLDYHLIMGAGLFTAVYIISRAVGKIGGAAFGSHIMKAPPTVKKYLGLTLLPHSGVSLVLTGIAISALTGPYSQYGDIVRGTIAAAAVINEVIAVFLAKQGFKSAGEIGKALPTSKSI